MMAALLELAEGNARPAATEIVFVGLVDEENAQAGARTFASSGWRANLGIVGEPTRLKIVTAHKGSLWLELETRGKSAHGARPELGSNAIQEMARVVNWLQTDYAALLRRRRHKLLGSATVSVGVIRGGTQANIVPDHCTIAVDRRTLPGETDGGVRREIRALLRHKKLRAFTSNGNGRLAPCLPLETNARLPMIAQFFGELGQRAPAGVDYYCDASVLGQGGIPSVVFGPGDIAQGHTADEWISLRSLDGARRALLRFLGSVP